MSSIDEPILFQLKGDFGVKVFHSHFEVDMYKVGQPSLFHYERVTRVSLNQDGNEVQDLAAGCLSGVVGLFFGVFASGHGNSSDIEFHIHFENGITEKYATLGVRRKKLKNLIETIEDRIRTSNLPST